MLRFLDRGTESTNEVDVSASDIIKRVALDEPPKSAYSPKTEVVERKKWQRWFWIAEYDCGCLHRFPFRHKVERGCPIHWNKLRVYWKVEFK